MAKKQPWFCWYANDWLSDEALRSCSLAARGLWADMLSLMHKCDRRGYLQLAGKPATAEQLARMTGCSTDEVSQCLAELLNSGVASALDDGTIYSRRMTRDEQKRHLCSEAGKRGGRPIEKGSLKGSLKGSYKGEPKPAYGYGSEEEKELSFFDTNTHSSGVGGVGEGEPEKGQAKGQAKGRAVDCLDPDFDRFLRAYPRKTAKMAARIAWTKLSPDAALVERILRAVEAQSRSEQWRRGIIPSPASWLEGCRWDDELPADKTVPEETIEQRIERARQEQCRANGPIG